MTPGGRRIAISEAIAAAWRSVPHYVRNGTDPREFVQAIEGELALRGLEIVEKAARAPGSSS